MVFMVTLMAVVEVHLQDPGTLSTHCERSRTFNADGMTRQAFHARETRDCIYVSTFRSKGWKRYEI